MERACKRCGAIAREETDAALRSEYPYYCPECDENLYSFETTEVPETGDRNYEKQAIFINSRRGLISN